MIKFLNGRKSSHSPIKLFSSIAEMNQSKNNKEGDLAVVYGSTISNWQVNTQSNIMIFPQTVKLNEAFTEFVDLRFRPVDESSGFVDFMGNIDQNQVDIQIMGDVDAHIRYSSEDGITYTKTEDEERVELPVAVKYEMEDMWNDVIGYFIQTGGMSFEGLYQYEKNAINYDYIELISLDSLHYDFDGQHTVNNITFEPVTDTYIEIDKLIKVLNKLTSDLSSLQNHYFSLCYNNADKTIYLIANNSSSGNDLCFDLEGTPLGITFRTDISIFTIIYKLDLSNCSYEEFKTSDKDIVTKYYYTNSSYYDYNQSLKYIPLEITSTLFGLFKFTDGKITDLQSTRGGSVTIVVDTVEQAQSGLGNYLGDYQYNNTYKRDDRYVFASTQFDATDEYVYNKSYLGKNGASKGTLGTDVSLLMNDVNTELFYKLQDIYTNSEESVILPDGFKAPKNIRFIPQKSDGTATWDTSHVTSMYALFRDCLSLKNVPLLDVSNVTNLSYMFYNCKNLLTISLSDILSAKSLSSMFCDCFKLTEISVSQIDASNATTMSNMFCQCFQLLAIPEITNTGNVTDMSSMFESCGKIESIPSLDTSSVKNMSQMFFGCNKLKNIPLLDTSNVTNMYEMFGGCSAFTDDDLNNVLQMCINAVKITNNKTLKYIRLSQEQAEKCQTLSNWQAFLDAGWLTG